MEDRHRFENIDQEAIDALLEEYPIIVPDKLADLDSQRYDVIPKALMDMTDSPSLSKEEVATLVDWKLSHGKFRPTLKSLVQQNASETVTETTRAAFQEFDGGSSGVKTSLDILTKLRGIGPATASLLLSVYAPGVVPFLSDELFRWCFYEDEKGKGWDRVIKYTLKEYMELFRRVEQIWERLPNLAAVDMEKAAYVLRKRAEGVTANGSEESGGKKRKVEDDAEGSSAVPKPTKKAKGSTKAIDSASITAKSNTAKTSTAKTSTPKRKAK